MTTAGAPGTIHQGRALRLSLRGVGPLAAFVVLGVALAGGAATADERPAGAADARAARSDCGPIGCPARRPKPWQHTAGFALAVGAAIWAAPRRDAEAIAQGAPSSPSSPPGEG